MLVHAVTGADAFFGSHADGRIQKASTGCFPVLANILGQESCLSNPSYSTCKPEILFTMLMRMGEDFSCPGNRLGIIVFLCPCKICSADGEGGKKRRWKEKAPTKTVLGVCCFLYTHPSGKWLPSKCKLTVKEGSNKSTKVIWRPWGKHSFFWLPYLNPRGNTAYHVLIPRGFLHHVIGLGCSFPTLKQAERQHGLLLLCSCVAFPKS